MRKALLLALAFLLPAAGSFPRFQPVAVPGRDFRLIPESQRSFGRVILGLEPLPADDRMLPPGVSNRPGDARIARLRDELYWTQFELLHGRILAAAPSYSRFFVAVPKSLGGTPGGEESSFRRYLATRLAWPPEEVRRRVRFFAVDTPLRFPRDMAEPIGRDLRERLVLAIGSDSDEFYSSALNRLVEAFPGDFRREVLSGVNTEGGDVSGVMLPDGKAGVVVGYHRIRRWVAKKYGDEAASRPFSATLIGEARAAFRQAFFGLEVLIVGEEELAGSAAESPELFHADMVVNVARGARGIVAIVPTYPRPAVDATTFAGLPGRLRERAQGVYDRAARLLADRGYRVLRIPFRDHPDRTPVQAAAYVDTTTGDQMLLLGRYPYHFTLPDGTNPQQRLQQELTGMEMALDLFRASRSDASWRRLSDALQRLRVLMDAMPSIPNPDFDAQAKLYSAEGIHVVPVPIYPTGEGGIHCLLLN